MKGKDTGPELALRRLLWARGRRFRLNVRVLGARPDLVFTRARVAVFVDGCFWHGCPHHYVRPRTRHAFWSEKLRGNIDRDRRQTMTLEAAGWTVLRVWEHDLEEDPAILATQIEAVLDGGGTDKPQWRVVAVEPQDTHNERRTFEDLHDPSMRREYIGPRNSRSGWISDLPLR